MLAITRASDYQQKALSAVGGDLNQIHIPDEKMLDEMASRIKFKGIDKDAESYNEPQLLCEQTFLG